MTYCPLSNGPHNHIISHMKTIAKSTLQKRFGKRIRELRDAIELSQEKFALKIEMDRTYLASVEAGKRNLSLVNISKLAQGFDITLEELFKGL